MNIRILYLKVLILILTIFVIGLSRIVFILFKVVKKTSNDTRTKDIVSLLISYVLIASLISVLNPNLIHIKLPNKIIWYAIGLGLSPLIILLEIFIGYLFSLGRSKKVELSKYWKNPNILLLFITVSIAFFEEFFFRQVWLSILSNFLNISMIFSISLSSFIYAVNHFYFGKEVIFEKFASGIVFGLLFYFSGDSIVIPFIAHAMEDILILEFVH